MVPELNMISPAAPRGPMYLISPTRPLSVWVQAALSGWAARSDSWLSSTESSLGSKPAARKASTAD